MKTGIRVLLFSLAACHTALADDSVTLLRSKYTYSLVATCLSRDLDGVCENLTLSYSGTGASDNPAYADVLLDSPEKIAAYLSRAESVRDWLTTPVAMRVGFNLSGGRQATDYPPDLNLNVVADIILGPLDIATAPIQAGFHVGQKIVIRRKILTAFENVQNFIRNQPTTPAPKVRSMFLNASSILRAPGH